VNKIAVEAAGIHPYQLRLPTFEGPFDVLLRLVERSQLQITDVSLIDVTDQFLAHIASMDATDAALIAEFSNVGSRLVVLKSRSLLPRPTYEPEDEVGDLAHELIEYQAYKQMAALFASRDAEGNGAFPRGTAIASTTPAAELPLANHQPAQLLRALRRRLTITPPAPIAVVARKLVTLREMAERVLHELRGGNATTFRLVMARCTDVHDARTGFLAVLVLARRNDVDVEQSELFGDITIRPALPVAAQDAFLTGLVTEDGAVSI